MRELEKVAKTNGMIEEDIFIPEIKKKASCELVETGDLFVDMLSLASALRNRGFNKQAILLEEKAVSYKKAYNTNTPTSTMEERSEREKHIYDTGFGDDVLNFAHKLIDEEDIPSKLNEGHVETIEEINKILIDDTKKNPTGKTGGDSSKKLVAAAIEALKKKGQAVTNTAENINGKIENLIVNAKARLFFTNNPVGALQILSSINPNSETTKKLYIDFNNGKTAIDKINLNSKNFHAAINARKATPSLDPAGIQSYDAIISQINSADKTDIQKSFIDTGLHQKYISESEKVVGDLLKREQEIIRELAVIAAANAQRIIKELSSNKLDSDTTISNIKNNVRKISRLNMIIKKYNGDNFTKYQLTRSIENIPDFGYQPDISEIANKFINILTAINKNQMDNGLEPISDVDAKINQLKDYIVVSEDLSGMLNYFDNLNSEIKQYQELSTKNNLKLSSNIQKVSWDPMGGKKAIPAGGGAPGGGGQPDGSTMGIQKHQSEEIRSMQARCVELGDVIDRFVAGGRGLSINKKPVKNVDLKGISNTAKKTAQGADRDGAWGTATEQALTKINQLTRIAGIQACYSERPRPGETADKINAKAILNNRIIMQLLIAIDPETFAHYAKQAYMKNYFDKLPASVDSSHLEEVAGSSTIVGPNHFTSMYALKTYLTQKGFITPA